MKFFLKSTLFGWTYLLLLFLGYIAAGWLLATYRVSWLVWLGTLGITLHLAIAETGAIVLANTWVVVIILSGIFFNTKISLNFLPFERAQIWALSLLIIWVFAIALIFMLAFAKTIMNKLCVGWIFKLQPYTSYILLSVIWIAIKCGYLIYKLAN
jgi:hypothetical protein